MRRGRRYGRRARSWRDGWGGTIVRIGRLTDERVSECRRLCGEPFGPFTAAWFAFTMSGLHVHDASILQSQKKVVERHWLRDDGLVLGRQLER